MRIDIRISKIWVVILTGFVLLNSCTGWGAEEYNPPERIEVIRPTLEGQTQRPMRYQPENGDFVIENGRESFNRPLYGGNTAFRIDAGDRPEFTLYLPGLGGNVRFGIKTPTVIKWLFEADKVISRYHPGAMIYEIHDAALGDSVLTVTVMAMYTAEGAIVQAELQGQSKQVELVIAYGGASGKKGKRNGDIGCESEPVAQFFRLRPENCKDNTFAIKDNTFVLESKSATIAGVLPMGAKLTVSDAMKWHSLKDLLEPMSDGTNTPVLTACMAMQPNQPLYFGLKHTGQNLKPLEAARLPQLFDECEKERLSRAEQVKVETPDAYINAAMSAICVAADAVWDQPQGLVMHGAVAWRSPYAGWRGPYANDALGWHERSKQHLTYWAAKQNTKPVPDNVMGPDPASNLSRSHPAKQSSGDIGGKHYDMNLVYIDALFRHILWTGDMELAGQLWPVIERHLAWEKRLFRRPFGPDKLPLYEAYAAIWASDDLQYSGGGVTHASAYNYYHNRMAARLAKLLGKDSAPYEQEADLILKAMHKYLWLESTGCFAEWKDFLGLQLAHPAAALWTVYHTIDSEVPTPQQAWQMTRYVDTQIAHIPIHGPGVPQGDYFTLPTSNWMPYTWSTNNVVMAEAAHMALAYYQAGRADAGFNLFKGCLLDSMYQGLCPGNLGMTTYFDSARGEAQRDFADSVGVCSRVMVEGLFGIRPDVPAGQLRISPGFPKGWEYARIKHPDIDFAYERKGEVETYSIEPKFTKLLSLSLNIPVFRAEIESVTINGQASTWTKDDMSMKQQGITICCQAQSRYQVIITWKGRKSPFVKEPSMDSKSRSGFDIIASQNQDAESIRFRIRNVTIEDLDRKVKVNTGSTVAKISLKVAAGRVSDEIIILSGKDSLLPGVNPISIDLGEPRTYDGSVTNWKLSAAEKTVKWETVDLSAVFNDMVMQIFKNQYLKPRSPYCSLSIPKQGIGSWCNFEKTFDVNDSGLRRIAGENNGIFKLPQGIPFKTPGLGEFKNIAFTSQWDNYPKEITTALSGKARHVYLLMAGSTNSMQSQFDNGEVIVTYTDGTTQRLALRNPQTWWPIDQDYFIDDYGFRFAWAIPPRVDLKTGKVRIPEKGKGGTIAGGAATVLDMPLDPDKELKSLTVRTLANEVVIGLMSATLVR
jgi:hypothetical protein